MIKKLLFSLILSLISFSPAFGAITGTSIVQGSASNNATSYTTSSITPSADKLILISIASRSSGGVGAAPTLTGNGLTWVNVTFVGDGNERAVSVFRAMGGSPSTGAITIDFGADGQSNCSWSIYEFSGMDTSGTNGSGAIVQNPTNALGSAGTSISVTFSAAGATDNALYSATVISDNLAMTEDTSWTELHEEQVNDGADSHTLQTQLRNPHGSDTTGGSSWSASESERAAIIGVEIKAAAGGGATRRRTNLV